MSTKKLQILGSFGSDIKVDSTLTQDGFAADAKATGDAINQVQANIDGVASIVESLNDKYYTEAEIDNMISVVTASVDAKSDSDHNHDDVYYTETEIDAKISTMQSDIDSKVDAVDGMGLSSNDYTTSEKDKLATIVANANFYEHPNHASHASGLYKVAVDELGHVSGATLAAKEDIVALGIPAQDTTYDAEISGLSGRVDDVENSINTTKETLSGVSQELENYKTTNNEAVSTNATNIETNKTDIKAIQDDYLTSTDRTQLQDSITQVSNKATANASAIEVLNGDGVGSVKQSIDNAFNEFASNVTNDDVVNTYKELIDYAATHSAEFVTLVGEVDTIKTDVSEIETDFSSYKTTVSDQFTEVDRTIDGHINDLNNPHGVNKEQIGLDRVDNTSDAEKPISNATQEALDLKADSQHSHEVAEVNGLQGLVNGLQANFDSHTSNKENPHRVTAEQVGTYTRDEIDIKFSLAGEVKILDSDDNVAGIIDVPVLSVERVDGGTNITATDNNGVTTSMVRDGKSAYAYAKDGGYTGTEEDFSSKLAETQVDKMQSKIVIRCSNIGMSENDENGNNYTLLCEAASSADEIVVDGMYVLNVTEVYEINKNIHIGGKETGCGFDLSNVDTVFNLGEQCYQLDINGLTFKNTSNRVAIFIRKDNYIAPRMDFVKFNGCNVEGKVSPIRFQQSIEVNPEEVDIGVDVISITNNTFLNGNATYFIFDDVSHDIIEISGNIIRNMGNSFLSCGVTNEHLYVDEATRSMKQAHIHHNDVYNDDTCFRSESASGTYYVFVLLEGDKVHYHHNRVEGMKANSYVALYDAYLSCGTVVYENNYWKNNCVFDESCPSNVLMKSKEKGTEIIGKRTYYDNTFITEKAFYEKFNALNNGYVRMIDSVSDNIFDVQRNKFELYRVSGFINTSNIKGFTFKNNDFKSDIWVDGKFCAGIDDAEIICSGNNIILEDGKNFNGVITGDFKAKKIIFENNNFKNCKIITGGKSKELVFNNNTIINESSNDLMISSYGSYDRAIGKGNKVVNKDGILHLFNAFVKENIDYEIESTLDNQKIEQKIFMYDDGYNSLDKRSITVEFDGYVVSGTRKEHFNGYVTVCCINGNVRYVSENGIVVEALNPTSLKTTYPKVTMLDGEKLPFEVMLYLSPVNKNHSFLMINKYNDSKIEMITRISSTEIEYIYSPENIELPDGYTQLDYIETDGNQYFNTNVKASNYPNGIRYVFVGNANDYNLNGNNYLFGSSENSKRVCNAYIRPDSSMPSRSFGIMIGMNNTRAFSTENYPTIGSDFILDVTCSTNDIENATASLNGVVLSGESGYSNTEMPNSLIYLLACNSALNCPFNGKLYKFEMYDSNGNAIRKFIPCIRIVDEVVGLYDTVNGTFYENIGTGNLTKPNSDYNELVSIRSIEQTTTSEADDGNNIITITLTNGKTAKFIVQNGSKGSDGYTPVKGTDYFTDEDKAELVTAVVAALPKYAGEVV